MERRNRMIKALAILYYVFAFLTAFAMSIEEPLYLKFGSIMLIIYFTFQLISAHEDN
jgi:hypothetical protein